VARRSKAGDEWHGEALSGAVRRGLVRWSKARQAWRCLAERGEARLGEARRCKAGGVWHGKAGHGSAGQALIRRAVRAKTALAAMELSEPWTNAT
jgi:hypothetical protein